MEEHRIPKWDVALYNPARRGVRDRSSVERITDENGELVDVERERGFIFDGTRARSEIRASARNDPSERGDGAAGWNHTGMLAGFFR